jgi:hypothetical protein
MNSFITSNSTFTGTDYSTFAGTDYSTDPCTYSTDPVHLLRIRRHCSYVDVRSARLSHPLQPHASPNGPRFVLLAFKRL